MKSDKLHLKRNIAKKKKRELIEIMRPSKWLIVCEGKKTEVNYFKGLIADINKKLDKDVKIKANIVGEGKSTTSLVNSAISLQTEIDRYLDTTIPYGKIFIVFDKDNFSDDEFNEAILMCKANGFIPLWSNSCIEFWFLLHFYYVDNEYTSKDCYQKLNDIFFSRNLGSYIKNDKEIYYKLKNSGSSDLAIKNAKKLFDEKKNNSPAKMKGTTTLYLFYEAIDEWLNEIK